MTHQPLQSQFLERKDVSSTDGFSIRRSQFLDAFARMEATITRIIATNDPQFDPKGPFGNKLKTLALLKANNRLSKKAIDRFAALPADISTLTRIRNDLGHGIMTVLYRNDEAIAAFQNAADYAVDFPQYTVLSGEDFESGRRRLLHLANELKVIATPPSQPQPLPDATTGP